MADPEAEIMDSLKGEVERIAQAENLASEVKALRKVVWMLARHNGGGLSLEWKDILAIPVGATLDAWNEDRARSLHIRARGA